MELNRLYEMLDIEDGSEFEYFENFADLVECSEEIGEDSLFPMMEDVDFHIFSEITANYFNDIMEDLPDSEMDLYTIFETVKRTFIGLATAADKDEDERENSILRLVEEIERFRQWYSIDCLCTAISEDGKEEKIPVRDGVFEIRASKVGGGETGVDFEKALDYPFEEYIMAYADLAEEEY